MLHIQNNIVVWCSDVVMYDVLTSDVIMDDSSDGHNRNSPLNSATRFTSEEIKAWEMTTGITLKVYQKRHRILLRVTGKSITTNHHHARMERSGDSNGMAHCTGEVQTPMCLRLTRLLRWIRCLVRWPIDPEKGALYPFWNCTRSTHGGLLSLFSHQILILSTLFQRRSLSI